MTDRKLASLLHSALSTAHSLACESDPASTDAAAFAKARLHIGLAMELAFKVAHPDLIEPKPEAGDAGKALENWIRDSGCSDVLEAIDRTLAT